MQANPHWLWVILVSFKTTFLFWKYFDNDFYVTQEWISGKQIYYEIPRTDSCSQKDRGPDDFQNLKWKGCLKTHKVDGAKQSSNANGKNKKEEQAVANTCLFTVGTAQHRDINLPQRDPGSSDARVTRKRTHFSTSPINLLKHLGFVSFFFF